MFRDQLRQWSVTVVLLLRLHAIIGHAYGPGVRQCCNRWQFMFREKFWLRIEWTLQVVEADGRRNNGRRVLKVSRIGDGLFRAGNCSCSGTNGEIPLHSGRFSFPFTLYNYAKDGEKEDLIEIWATGRWLPTHTTDQFAKCRELYSLMKKKKPGRNGRMWRRWP